MRPEYKIFLPALIVIAIVSSLANYQINRGMDDSIPESVADEFRQEFVYPALRYTNTDVNVRALLALGQLYTRVNEVPAAKACYGEWLEFTRGMDGLEAQTARVEQQLNGLRDL